ncbi:hypothetical protein [Parapedobacter sp. 10938]|uniref:hypothetical protein n=1 Tax=Parapedobacter flavus TaxID=3110225 RepID=UPI002DBAB3A8|nr:hypothetical protein [Parapedobacter sp. 10938]MEC3882002.1 hypothetical protein [Parapedobacter sp. 10938]
MSAVLITLAACSEFFEEPIDGSEVVLLSPGEGVGTTTYVMQFLWEPLDNALVYQLQVAAPSFASPIHFYADTLLEKHFFRVSLEPGAYQWRVRALNGSSETAYSTRSFDIHEAALSHQTVLQEAPAENHVTGQEEIKLSWQSIFNATGYRLQVDTNSFIEGEKPLLEEEIEGWEVGLKLPREHRYQWRVRAENDTAYSRWSSVRTFVVDRTPPPAPVLSLPANNAQVSRPVDISWEKATGSSTYMVYVYKADSTLFSGSYPIRQTGTSFTFHEGSKGETILWRVRAVDPAGNVSNYSRWRGFYLRN